MRGQEKDAEPPHSAQTGWCWLNKLIFWPTPPQPRYCSAVPSSA